MAQVSTKNREMLHKTISFLLKGDHERHVPEFYDIILAEIPYLGNFVCMESFFLDLSKRIEIIRMMIIDSVLTKAIHNQQNKKVMNDRKWGKLKDYFLVFSKGRFVEGESIESDGGIIKHMVEKGMGPSDPLSRNIIEFL